MVNTRDSGLTQLNWVIGYLGGVMSKGKKTGVYTVHPKSLENAIAYLKYVYSQYAKTLKEENG